MAYWLAFGQFEIGRIRIHPIFPFSFRFSLGYEIEPGGALTVVSTFVLLMSCVSSLLVRGACIGHQAENRGLQPSMERKTSGEFTMLLLHPAAKDQKFVSPKTDEYVQWAYNFSETRRCTESKHSIFQSLTLAISLRNRICLENIRFAQRRNAQSNFSGPSIWSKSSYMSDEA